MTDIRMRREDGTGQDSGLQASRGLTTHHEGSHTGLTEKFTGVSSSHYISNTNLSGTFLKISSVLTRLLEA